jgi:hypothetical protein
MVVEDPHEALNRAEAIIARHAASTKRRKVKSAPRVKAEKGTKAQRADNWQRVKALVLGRASGRCELCGAGGFNLDCHHLAPGSLRKKYEAPNAVVATCRTCHRQWHSGVVTALVASLDAADRIDAPDVIRVNLSRRVQKATP